MTAPPEVLATCPCGEPIIRRTNRAREAERKFCSRRCSGVFGNLPPPGADVLGTCRCGAAIKRSPGRSLAAERKRGRKYCSPGCAVDARRGQPAPWRQPRAGTAKPKPPAVKAPPEPVAEPVTYRWLHERGVPGWGPEPKVRRTG